MPIERQTDYTGGVYIHYECIHGCGYTSNQWIDVLQHEQSVHQLTV